MNHPDFDLFRSVIFPKVDIHDEVHTSAVYFMDGRLSEDSDEFHVRVPVQRLFWDDRKIALLRKRFDKLNSMTNKLQFVLGKTCDWDEEIGERTWDARIYFTVKGI